MLPSIREVKRFSRIHDKVNPRFLRKGNLAMRVREEEIVRQTRPVKTQHSRRHFAPRFWFMRRLTSSLSKQATVFIVHLLLFFGFVAYTSRFNPRSMLSGSPSLRCNAVQKNHCS